MDKFNKPKYAKVEGREGIVRDLSSNALVSINDEEYRKQKLERTKIINAKRGREVEINTLKEQLNKQQVQLDELKTLVHSLISRE